MLSKRRVAILITVESGIVHNNVSDISQTLVFVAIERFVTFLRILSLNSDFV